MKEDVGEDKEEDRVVEVDEIAREEGNKEDEKYSID